MKQKLLVGPLNEVTDEELDLLLIDLRGEMWERKYNKIADILIEKNRHHFTYKEIAVALNKAIECRSFSEAWLKKYLSRAWVVDLKFLNEVLDTVKNMGRKNETRT